MLLYAMNAAPDRLPSFPEFVLLVVVLAPLVYGITRKHLPLKAQHRFKNCRKCIHGKRWCIFATPEGRALFKTLPFDEQIEHALKCLRICQHIPTEPCGVESEQTEVGQCHHKYEMCVMPKAHRNPAMWARIQQVDSGKSFVEFVEVKNATESDREAHREMIRKRESIKEKRLAASSPPALEVADEVDEPA